MGVKKFYRPVLGYDGQMIDGGGAGEGSVPAEPNSVAQRDASGALFVGTATDPEHAVTLSQMNTELANEIDYINTSIGSLTAADVGALPDSYAPTWAQVSGKPSTFAPTIGTTATTAKAGNYQPTWAQVTGKPEFGTAATTDASAYATSAQGTLAASAVQPGDLSSVATSGAYSDLSGVPTIPVVSFATISAIEGDWRGEGVETLGAALLALQGV